MHDDNPTLTKNKGNIDYIDYSNWLYYFFYLPVQGNKLEHIEHSWSVLKIQTHIFWNDVCKKNISNVFWVLIPNRLYVYWESYSYFNISYYISLPLS